MPACRLPNKVAVQDLNNVIQVKQSGLLLQTHSLFLCVGGWQLLREVGCCFSIPHDKPLRCILKQHAPYIHQHSLIWCVGSR
jgi:hypothetical protein